MTKELLYATHPDFLNQLNGRLAARRFSVTTDVDVRVRSIIDGVKTLGDAALVEMTGKYDKLFVQEASQLRLDKVRIDQLVNAADASVISALSLAYERIYDHHQRQLPADELYQDKEGVTLGWRWTPLASVGLYVPGGKASYPSSVLMNAIPAIIAGVERLVMVVPAHAGHVEPLVVAAAKMCGIDEIYTIGGAQAVAALAIGTETITGVDKIVGPGNKYVAEAKRQLFGQVGIDAVAGPSEVLIIADKTGQADFIAADIIAQCEHDEDAQGIVITDDENLGREVINAIDEQLAVRARSKIATASWRQHGLVIIVNDLQQQGARIADIIAAEHVEIITAEPEAMLAKINNGGAFFLGAITPEAMADYVAGTNHVLPTTGAARFSSGLSVFDFIKRSSILKCDHNSYQKLAQAASAIAMAEGLEGHSVSLMMRDKLLERKSFKESVGE